MKKHMNYYEISLLSNFYFEDSYVLAIHETIDSLTFELDAVLTERHPRYKKPREGEQYCYRKISLQFLNANSVEWSDRKLVAFSDSSGEVDYGNIDSFVRGDDFYMLSGDWGRVIIKGVVDLVLVE